VISPISSLGLPLRVDPLQTTIPAPCSNGLNMTGPPHELSKMTCLEGCTSQGWLDNTTQKTRSGQPMGCRKWPGWTDIGHLTHCIYGKDHAPISHRRSNPPRRKMAKEGRITPPVWKDARLELGCVGTPKTKIYEWKQKLGVHGHKRHTGAREPSGVLRNERV
jgi:hypothetical protein